MSKIFSSVQLQTILHVSSSHHPHWNSILDKHTHTLTNNNSYFFKLLFPNEVNYPLTSFVVFIIYC